ncbi:MAG: hypothetical protein H6817_09520 [Phycisphaerales bacterium]|nr:hypothetical protein [Phycisphaerales bacterium]
MTRYGTVIVSIGALVVWFALARSAPLKTADGATIFAHYDCADCHGADGEGNFGPRIHNVDSNRLDRALRSQESRHTGGRFPQLSDEHLAALTAFLAMQPTENSASASDALLEPTNALAAIHTIDVAESGMMHGTGYREPLTHCTRCHGADLTGGNKAPSCTSCHDAVWEN